MRSTLKATCTLKAASSGKSRLCHSTCSVMYCTDSGGYFSDVGASLSGGLPDRLGPALRAASCFGPAGRSLSHCCLGCPCWCMAAAQWLLRRLLGRLLRPLVGWLWLGEAGMLVSCRPVSSMECGTCCPYAAYQVFCTCSQRQQHCQSQEENEH